MEHLINLSFLCIFSVLAFLHCENLKLRVKYTSVVVSLVLLVLISGVSWVFRDDWDISGLARSLTWLTPMALLLGLNTVKPLRHRVICYVIAGASLITNVFVTVFLAKFNSSIAKFEVTASWTWISSNELSFHMIAFGFLFLVLASVKTKGFMALVVGFGSLIHLSKAHIVAVVVAPVVGMCRRRIWLLILIGLLVAGILQWLAFSESAADFQIPESVARAFDPLRDMARLVAKILFSGDLLNFGVISDSVGLFRFELYEGAIDLLPKSSVGHSQRVIDAALRGLDPHSNIVYLVLREGWVTLFAYLVTTLVLIRRMPTRNPRERIVMGVLVYIFLRSLFLTFDPVKLLCIALYASAVLESQENQSVLRSGPA